MPIPLNYRNKKRLRTAVKTHGTDKVKGVLKDAGELKGLKDQYSSQKKAESKGPLLGVDSPVSKKPDMGGLKDVSIGKSPVYENKKGLLTTGITPLSKPLSGKQVRPDDKIKSYEDKGFKLDDKGNILDDAPTQTDVLGGKLTEVEFNKQKAEQEKLKQEEINKSKKIGEYEKDYRTSKDYLTTMQERAESDLSIASEDSIRKADTAHKNLQHNVNMARSGLGMPESKVETEAFDNILAESRSDLLRLNTLSSTRKTRLEEDYARQFDSLNTERKKVFDNNMRNLLDEMSLSDIEGSLDTKAGLAELRTKLQDVLYSDEEMAMANIQRYQFGINQLKTQITELEDYETNAKTINESTSKMKGYYVNENGDPFLDDNGDFINIPDQSEIIYKSDPDINGKMTIFTRGEDGVISQKTFNTGLTGETTTPKPQEIGTDKYGNKQYGIYNPETKSFDPVSISGTTTPSVDYTPGDYSTLDYSSNQEIIDKYEGEASFKNNNPTGMTWGISSNLKGLFEKAGVKYDKGTARPLNEGGNYIKFNSAQDGLDAYTIALTQAGSDNIYKRLATWVGTEDSEANHKYATELMEQAGIGKDAKFSELSENQLGTLMSAQLQRESPNFYNELANLEPEQKQEVGPEVSPTDIMTFNSSTFKPQKDIKSKEQDDKYKAFVKEKAGVMSNKDATIEDILKYSAGGKDLTDTSVKSLTKFDQALSQLGEIQEQISDLDTGPVMGRLQSLDPWNSDVRTLKASLTALLPSLARGVYGEVGVLTDNDIRLYSQTIPNMNDTKATNQAILGMTLKIVAGGYKKQLQTLAASGQDVSGFQGLYDGLMAQVDSIETSLKDSMVDQKEEGSSIKDLADKYSGGTKPVPDGGGVKKEESEEDLYKKYYK